MIQLFFIALEYLDILQLESGIIHSLKYCYKEPSATRKNDVYLFKPKLFRPLQEDRSKKYRAEKWVSYLHRTASTTYPCYLPILGEFSGSWSYKTYPREQRY